MTDAIQAPLPCWILRETEGDGIIADPDGRNLMFRTPEAARRFAKECGIYAPQFAVYAISDAADLLAYAQASGQGAAWCDCLGPEEDRHAAN